MRKYLAIICSVGLLALTMASCSEERVYDVDGRTVLTMEQYENMKIRLQAKESEEEVEAIEKKDLAAIGSHFNRAVSFYKGREYEKALEFFQESIKQNPANARAWYMQGMTYRQLGDEKSANDSFTRAYEITNTTNTQAVSTAGSDV